MTAVQVATGIIDKLQEENRICLETLHKAQDTIKYSERQLAEKNRVIKVLEERIRSGTDGILEMTNRQKDLTIKHLEMQIQNLMKEKDDLEVRLEALKAEICPKCETKLLISENRGGAVVSKSSRLAKQSSVILGKKSSQSLCPNRVKSLEKIIEHKDKRIDHLSKEVQRLTKLEEELTQKIYRLTKLLPMSRLPPETITDCLLKEIQQLESQKQQSNGIYEPPMDSLSKLTKPSTSYVSSNKTNLKSTERFKTSSFSKIKTPIVNEPISEQVESLDAVKFENEVLYKKLQKLCHDINELKRLFAFESEKFSHGLNSTANEYRIFKMNLEEMLNNLNEIMQDILSGVFKRGDEDDLESQSDDKHVIVCLQDRLKESLGVITECEIENKTLRESIEKLRAQIAQQSRFSDYKSKSGNKLFKSHSDSKRSLNINDTKKLQEIIKIKESQLEDAERHIKSCEKLIDEMQENLKHSTLDYKRKSSDKLFKFHSDSKSSLNINDTNKLKEIIKIKESQLEDAERHIKSCEKLIDEMQENLEHSTVDRPKTQHSPSRTDDVAVDNSLEQENKILQTKLNVAEKNIKTCENVIEQLQNTVRNLEEENEKIESELHELKSKAISEESSTSFSKLSEIRNLKKLNKELQDKVNSLEETVIKLEGEINSEKNKSEALVQEKMGLQSKLDAAERQINTLEKSVENLQEKLKTSEEQRREFEDELKEIIQSNNLAEKYEHDVMALKNELILQQDENRELKEALHTLENKTLEMNHHRKSLHQEIENLCKALMERDESDADNERRKAIYKAAVLRSAQALLRLDDNFNLKTDDPDRSSSALDEMTHQIQVYLTEVSRIHELLTIKHQERDELLKEYLDLDDDAVSKLSTPRHFESRVQGQPVNDDLRSSSNLNLSKSPVVSSSEKSAKTVTLEKENVRLESMLTVAELKNVQEELAATKSVTAYLLSSCTRLEDLLTKERTDRIKCEKELEVYQETIKDLKSQLGSKSTTTKRLNTLIDLMRTKEFNDEISLEQLKTEIQWLAEKATTTESELCQYKEENCKMKSDLNSMKRELMNEKYEKAKTNNELKQLKMQILNSQTILDETPIT